MPWWCDVDPDSRKANGCMLRRRISPHLGEPGGTVAGPERSPVRTPASKRLQSCRPALIAGMTRWWSDGDSNSRSLSRGIACSLGKRSGRRSIGVSRKTPSLFTGTSGSTSPAPRICVGRAFVDEPPAGARRTRRSALTAVKVSGEQVAHDTVLRGFPRHPL
jgi:hypothetical protein